MNELFQVHILNDVGIEKAKKIAADFDALLTELEKTCGITGREITIVRTNLEQACFFAKKAMANREENQK